MFLPKAGTLVLCIWSLGLDLWWRTHHPQESPLLCGAAQITSQPLLGAALETSGFPYTSIHLQRRAPASSGLLLGCRNLLYPLTQKCLGNKCMASTLPLKVGVCFIPIPRVSLGHAATVVAGLISHFLLAASPPLYHLPALLLPAPNLPHKLHTLRPRLGSASSAGRSQRIQFRQCPRSL